MGNRGRLLGLLVYTIACHLAGVYLFTTGFFITRVEMPDVYVGLQ
jgi:hypothetical protein